MNNEKLIKKINNIGDLSKLTSTNKDNLVDAIEEHKSKLNTQLDNMTNGNYIGDNTIIKDQPFLNIYSMEWLRTRQSYLYATFMRNLRKGVAQKICCQGDSLTYGHDVVSSDKRPPSSDIAPDGSTAGIGSTRASITYPEALEKYLKRLYPNISVINRGRSGNSCKDGYNIWCNTANTNLTIFMYGTNDSRASWVDYKGDVKKFTEWYEKLICREITRGSAVVILTPPRETENDIDISTFRQALYEMAKKYGIKVIKTDEMLSNYGSDIWSDEVHFNGKGYDILGSRLASLFIGEGLETVQYVNDGSKINAIPTLYNISKTGDVYFSKNTSVYPTANGVHMGINNGAISISFYSDVDDLLVFPSLYVRGTCNFKVELDFGVEQGKYTNTQLIDKGDKGVTDIAPSSLIESVTGTYPYYNRYRTPSKYIHIVSKGWHTITVTNNGTADNNVILYGLEFVSYNTLKALGSVIPPLTDVVVEDSGLSNGFKNVGVDRVIYYKTMQGEVQLNGVVSGGVDNGAIISLPVGFRPKTSDGTYFPIVAKKQDNSYTTLAVNIASSGNVYLVGSMTGIVKIWLSSIRFKAYN